jgi:hypothetical protein
LPPLVFREARFAGGKVKELMRRIAPILLVVAALLAGLLFLGRGTGSAPPVTTFAAESTALRDAFNRDVGNVRLLLIVDPT